MKRNITQASGFKIMNKILPALFAILLLLSCNEDTNSAKEISDNQALKDSLSAEIIKINDNHFNGLGVALVDSTGILYEQGMGYADIISSKPYTINTVQPIASVSKTLIGITLMIAQEKGLLQLDDPVNNYLPFAVQNPNFPNEPITIRQLATHNSSIIDNENYIEKAYILKDKMDSSLTKNSQIPQSFNPIETKLTLAEYLKNYFSIDGSWHIHTAFSANKPGQLFEYSNVGAALAALIIERVSNQPYSDFTTEYILKPLKMTHSGWDYTDVDFDNVSTLYNDPKTPIPHYTLITYPDGGFLTSIHDLALYLNELIKGYSGKGTLLTPKSYQELFTPQLSEAHFEERDATNPYDDEYNTGIFMGFSAMDNIGHTGGDPGVSTMLFFNPKEKIGRILFINTNINTQEDVNAFYGIFDALEKYSKTL
jgi:CubicO group peptidase (beta-lactamase class C family)